MVNFGTCNQRRGPLVCCLVALLGCLAIDGAVSANSPHARRSPSTGDPSDDWHLGSVVSEVDASATLEQQLARQAALIAELQEKIGRYDAVFSGLEAGACNAICRPVKRRPPLVIEETIAPCECASSDEFRRLDFYSDYDGGFLIKPFDADELPFSLRVNGWIQLRHHGFARDATTWTDNASVTRRIRNRNAFDIERARLYFRGSALDERLSYFYHLDGDTDGGHSVDFFDYWWAWTFSDSFHLQFGKRKVTASRQWLLGARRTRFVDRPMANDFFRPDRTVGLFALGSLGDWGQYEMMVGNGCRTANLPPSITDDQFTYAITHYLEPWGEFGSQIVDYNWSREPLARIGHSFIYSPMTSEELGRPLTETDFIRLADGTQLNHTGALAPGVTVSDVDLYFYGVDLAWKYRGWSVTSELFFRWLGELRADGALPHQKLYQHGYYVEGGKFLIPRKLDANFRYSQVDGLYGSRSEYAAGTNWYPLDTFKMKLTFDVTWLDGSPLQNTTSDILVGDDGVLFRSQIQAEF